MTPRCCFRILCACTAALLLQAGCATVRMPAPPVLDVSRLDTRPLHGRVIVIDPGHGGPEAGAVGARGLEEKEVNLGVSLYLWGLLQQAGARPLLTRHTDTSVCDIRPFDLRRDLAARAAFSSRAGADLFVSIHHNASAAHPRMNDLIVFYSMADPGPSRDVAGAISAGLRQALSRQSAGVAAGNFSVLRNSSAPAVLGEASFMTHKKNAGRLAFHRTLRAEAQGYFLGILDYFARGVPRVRALPVQEHAPFEARPRFSMRLDPGSDTALIDPGTIRATLNGADISSRVQVDNTTLSYIPGEPLPNRPHRFCVSVRNTAGNVSPAECVTATVSLPPARASIAARFPVVPPDGMSRTPLDIAVQDRLGRPVIDGTPVRLSATGGTLMPAEVRTAQGRARAVLIAGEQQGEALISATSGGIAAQCRVAFGTPGPALFAATIRDPDGAAIAGVRLLRNGVPVDMSDAGGWVYDSIDAAEPVSYLLEKSGYHPAHVAKQPAGGAMAHINAVMDRVDGGVFFKRSIVLDAAGQTGAALPLLRHLQDRLTAAGAEAALTWDAPAAAPPERRRVALAQQMQADVFLSVATGRGRPAAGYYHASARGQALAGLLAAHLPSRRPPRLEHSGAYVIVQTAMPAARLRLPAAADPDAAARAADGIYAALRDFLAPAAAR